MNDFTVPEEPQMTIDGLIAFVRREVVPLEEAHRDPLEDLHESHGPSGRLVPKVVELRRRVRSASARAGYHTLLAPADVGGAGLGPSALFLV